MMHTPDSQFKPLKESKSHTTRGQAVTQFGWTGGQENRSNFAHTDEAFYFIFRHANLLELGHNPFVSD